MLFMIPIRVATCLKNEFGTEPISERTTSLTGVPMYFGITTRSRQVLLGLLLYGTNLILALQGQILYLVLLLKQKPRA